MHRVCILCEMYFMTKLNKVVNNCLIKQNRYLTSVPLPSDLVKIKHFLKYQLLHDIFHYFLILRNWLYLNSKLHNGMKKYFLITIPAVS